MIVLDTNTLIRFFTNDIPQQADMVKKILASNNKVHVPNVVLPEIEYVLSQAYHVTRSELVEAFTFLSTRKNINLNKEAKVAINIFQASQLDMADCLVLAVASNKHNQLATFDQNLQQVATELKSKIYPLE